MMKGFIVFKLNEDNFIILSNQGGRIMKLVLNGLIVIQAQQPYEQLGSGSYLMYPWVNRLEERHALYTPVFYDGAGLPLHGLVVNTKNSLQNFKESL